MNRSLVTHAAFAVVAATCLLLQWASLFERADLDLLDQQFRFLRTAVPHHVTPDVVVVGIDEEATEHLPEPLVMWHPYLGRFLEAMATAQPAVVGIDLVLPARSAQPPLVDDEKALLEGFLKARDTVPVVFAQTITGGRHLRPILPTLVSVAGSEAFALILVAADEDGTVRHFQRDVDFEHGTLPTLAAALASRIGVVPTSGLIDFGLGAPMRYVPFRQVLQWHEAGDTRSLRTTFQGRPVLLGSILPFEDRHKVPVALLASEPDRRTVPGVFVHAQALRSLVANRMLLPAPKSLLLAATLAATLGWWLGVRPFWGGVALLVASAFTVAAAGAALSSGVYVPVVGIVFTAGLTFIARVALEAAFTAAERRRLRDSFGRYVSPPVLAEILAGNIKPELGGTRQPVCLLFADIRDFTKRSEFQTPEAVITLLNRYLTEMTRVIHAHGGTLDKFIGDGIMAFFGAPNPSPTAVTDAFLASRRMLGRLESLNRELANEGTPPIEIGIALHYGEVVVGHIGSATRHEYTTIGDAVNIASRLQGLCRTLGYKIVCSREVVDGLTPGEKMEDLGMHELKGRSPVRVFGYRPAELQGE